MSRSSARNETVISHHNRLDVVPEGLTASPETILSWVERDAAPVIERFLTGGSPTRKGRARFALFLAFQQMRTPQGRQWQVTMQEIAAKLTLKRALGDHAYVRNFLEGQGDSLTPDEIDDWRWSLIEQIDAGSLAIRVSHDREIRGMFMAAVRLLPAIAQATVWFGLRAPEGSQFILADHPIAIHDPQAGPGDPVAWLSSPTVEVTIPLSPSFCLLLRPGAPAYRARTVGAMTVDEINLRSYASAHWSIYGPSEESVRQVRMAAERAPDRVAAYEPRAPMVTLAERFAGEPEPFRVVTHQPPARGSRAKRRP